jgi:mannose-6-phosphate isomerase-like protein (cupin superfamily)
MRLTARVLFLTALGTFALATALPLAAGQAPTAAAQTLAQRIAHTSKTGYPARGNAVHGGANSMGFGQLFGSGTFGPHFNFMHRGEIPPGAGIGHHFHNTADEMFVILNGEAQFTIDGRTALVKGPVGVVCKAGHSHAVYNASNETLQWINFNVSVNAGISDAFDLGDDRVGAALDKVPTFVTSKLGRDLIGAGGRGRGAAAPAAPVAPQPFATRRAADPSIFGSPWSYLDQVLIQPGAASPAKTHDTIAEAYYVLAGTGTVTIGTETAPFGKWDAIPVRLGETSTFTNSGTEPLEMIVYGVAKDMDSKLAMQRSGRGGRAAGPPPAPAGR